MDLKGINPIAWKYSRTTSSVRRKPTVEFVSLILANYLQKIDYTYNIRGWLKEVNDVNANQTISNQGDLFSFKINYDQVENPVGNITSLHNGNISETY